MNRPRSVHLITGFGILFTLVAFALLLVVRSGGGTEGGSTAAPTRVEVTPISPGSDAVPTSPDLLLVDSTLEPPPEDPEGFVRESVEALSSRPELTSWLMTDGLIDRFVLAVEAVAGGYSPRDQFSDFAPVGRFHVTQVGGDRLEITAASYARYNTAAEVFGSLNVDGVVALLERIEPECESRHQELAWVRGTFRDTLVEAMDHLLATPRLAVNPEVVPGIMSYHYADRELEELSDAQRHLLRMGSRNAGLVLDKLLAIREAYAGPVPAEAADEAEYRAVVQIAEASPPAVTDLEPIGAVTAP